MTDNSLKTNSAVYCSLNELESLAQEKLNQMTFDYYAGGAGDELTLRDNIEAFNRIKLFPRMLVDSSKLSMEVEILGTRLASPLMIAPMAFQRLAHDHGEIAMARAAGRAGCGMVVSTLATSSLEEIAEAAPTPLWFQLYVYKDRQITIDLLERAAAAGFKAIVVTVDSPVLGRRFRDMRNLFHLPSHLKCGNLTGALQSIPEKEGDSGLAAYIASMYDVSLTWESLRWITKQTKLPVLVKGVLRADDTKLAIESGAAGIIVSNHGGRQLDTTVATIDALSDVVNAANGEVPVIVDGGIRRGTDILKALAFGAKAVLVGRPMLWGLALEGEVGVYQVIETLKDELRNALILSGYPDVGSVDRSLLGA